MPDNRDDFVRRLRVRWDAMGDMANNERSRAAAEIEWLRNECTRLACNNAKLVPEVDRIRAERDEARRTVCAFMAHQQRIVAGRDVTGEKIAEQQGWDCFKEDTDD